MLAGAVDSIDAGTTGFVGLGGGANPAATSAAGDSILPVSGTLSDLYVVASPSTGATGTVVATVERNDVATAVTCTITLPSRTCSDVTDMQSFAAGDTITVQIVNSSGQIVDNIHWTAALR